MCELESVLFAFVKLRVITEMMLSIFSIYITDNNRLLIDSDIKALTFHTAWAARSALLSQCICTRLIVLTLSAVDQLNEQIPQLISRIFQCLITVLVCEAQAWV